MFDCGVSEYITYSVDGLLDYRECVRWMRTADGDRLPIVRTGSISAYFRPAAGAIHLILSNVAHVPGLSRHISSLSLVVDAGNKYAGDMNCIITITLTTETINFAPSVGELN